MSELKSIRIPSVLYDRVERYRDLVARQWGITLSFSAALNRMVEIGLDTQSFVPGARVAEDKWTHAGGHPCGREGGVADNPTCPECAKAVRHKRNRETVGG